MKNILKKLGVIGLAIAVLAPFIDLPVVEAAEGECSIHLQNYLFLDVNNGLATQYGTSNGYITYTTFPYLFANYDSEEVTVTKAGINNFSDANSTEINNFYSLAQTLNSKINNWPKADTEGNYFVNSSTEYASDTALLHGSWSNKDENGDPLSGTWQGMASSHGATDYTSLQQNNNLAEGMEFKVGAAVYKGNGNVFKAPSTGAYSSNMLSSDGTNESSNIIVDYLNDIIDDPISAEDSGYIWGSGSDTEHLYVNFTVARKISETALKGTDYIYDDGAIHKQFADYDNFITFKNSDESVSEALTAASATDITDTSSFDKTNSVNAATGNYWPAVLYVEYKVCPTATTGKWDLKYDKNTTESVSNMPSGQSNIDLNTKVKIANGPTLSGKAFTGWCTDKEGKGSCYKADQEITSTTSTTITLYAQWGEPGTTDNKKTGVVSYIIGFISVGAIAGGIYLVSKKKNLFKQI